MITTNFSYGNKPKLGVVKCAAYWVKIHCSSRISVMFINVNRSGEYRIGCGCSTQLPQLCSDIIRCCRIEWGTTGPRMPLRRTLKFTSPHFTFTLCIINRSTFYLLEPISVLFHIHKPRFLQIISVWVRENTRNEEALVELTFLAHVL